LFQTPLGWGMERVEENLRKEIRKQRK